MKTETGRHRAMRTVLLLLAGAGTGCILIGIAGVALGMSETLFVIFAAIAMALLGLALLFVEQATVAREEREARDVDEIRTSHHARLGGSYDAETGIGFVPHARAETDRVFLDFTEDQRRLIAEAFQVPAKLILRSRP